MVAMFKDKSLAGTAVYFGCGPKWYICGAKIYFNIYFSLAKNVVTDESYCYILFYNCHKWFKIIAIVMQLMFQSINIFWPSFEFILALESGQNIFMPEKINSVVTLPLQLSESRRIYLKS